MQTTKAPPLSEEQVRLIDSIIEQMALLADKSPSSKEIREKVAPNGDTLSEVELRVLNLELTTKYRKQNEKLKGDDLVVKPIKSTKKLDDLFRNER